MSKKPSPIPWKIIVIALLAAFLVGFLVTYLPISLSESADALPESIALTGGKTSLPCVFNDNKAIYCEGQEAQYLDVEQLSDNQIALLDPETQNYCADEGRRITCDRTKLGPWETFTYEKRGGNKITLRGGNRGKLCADEGGRIRCDRDKVGPWEIFTYTEGKGRSKGTRTMSVDDADDGPKKQTKRAKKQQEEEEVVDEEEEEEPEEDLAKGYWERLRDFIASWFSS